MASVDPKIIQGIRVRKQAQELLKSSEQFQTMRDRLVELSGLREHGINPEELVINDEYLPTILKAAEEALNSGKVLPEETAPAADAEKPVRTRRQII
jgi:hypothetical protein